jgi:hypothetical protein
MRVFGGVPATLVLTLALSTGCSSQWKTERPYYANAPLHSLCDHDGPLTVANRGIFDAPNGGGELLLAAHLTNQPVEAYLGFWALRLAYVPERGLEVTLVDTRGAELSELIPAAWIRCGDNAMEVELPSDAFYVWASVGVKSRRLRLQVTADEELVMQNLWEEKGMAVMVFPLRVAGDGWAMFPPDDPAIHAEPRPIMTVGLVNGCPELAATYSVDGTSVRLDGSIDYRAADAHFFRPETAGGSAMQPGDAPAAALRIAHAGDGSIDLTLVRTDGTELVRRLERQSLSCDEGRWLAKGVKERMPVIMLAMGTMGSWWEDLLLWRDVDGALMVRGIYRSHGAVFLIPTGTTSELFVRFDLLPEPPSSGASLLILGAEFVAPSALTAR